LPTKRVKTKKPLQAKTHRNQEAVADQNASKPRSRCRQKRIETKKPLPTKTHQYTESAACKTHQQPAPVARDTQIYKKVLGSRRYLATVFWSLSTATSDTQRERAFVKTAYPSQHTQSTKRFANNMTHPTKRFASNVTHPTKRFVSNVTHPTKRFTSNVHNLRKSFTYNGPPTTILQKGAHNHGKMAKITLSTQPPSRS
jgi:hypothetical protein